MECQDARFCYRRPLLWGRWWAGEGKRIIVIRWFSLPRYTPTPPQDNTLGSQLKYLRLCLGETQKKFATLTGHPASLISRYEQNKVKRPNAKVLIDFAKALKVSPDKLLSIQEFRPICSETEFDSLFEHLILTKDFGSKLRNSRIRAGIGQTALAQKVGLNRESIRRYEKNITRPHKEILSRIVDVLKASSKELQEEYYHKTPTDSRDLERRT